MAKKQQPKEHFTETVVIGNGWSAIVAAAYLRHSQKNLIWVTGTGSRILPPLPTFQNVPGLQTWRDLAARLDLGTQEMQTGEFVRCFVNKAFRNAKWEKDYLWDPERRLAGFSEVRLDKSVAELEQNVRSYLEKEIEQEENALVRLDVPVTAVDWETKVVTLANGQTVQFEKAIFADRTSSMRGIAGMPEQVRDQSLPALERKWASAGAVQVIFKHEPTVGDGIIEGFSVVPYKDAKDSVQRSLWGHFFDRGRQSVWTMLLGANELEDNHEIVKKIRRIKQTLNRMFTGVDWVPTEVFTDSIHSEYVRFEESLYFSTDEKPEGLLQSEDQPLTLLLDGYGPTHSAYQVNQLLGDELKIPAEKMEDYESADLTVAAETTAEAEAADPK